jgi:ISXO2-like transposase domain
MFHRPRRVASLSGRFGIANTSLMEFFSGGYVKPANLRDRRLDRRLASNQSGKRKAVVVIRERGGNTIPAVFRSEKQALSFVKVRIAKGTTVNADESANWNDLHSRFEMKRINHEEAYSIDGACTNWAEEFFSRMRRAEIGHAPSYRRGLSAPVRARGIMARRQSACVKWGSSAAGFRARHAS